MRLRRAGGFQANGTSAGLDVIRGRPQSIAHLMCHPVRPGAELCPCSYRAQREVAFRALCDPG